MCALAHTASPSLWQRSATPSLAGAGIAASAVYVGIVTPGEGRTVPCPFHAATGLWCPGCGMTRAAHHLLNGDLAGALSRNLFLPLVIAGIAIAWWSWFAGRMWAHPVRWPSRVDTRWWYGLFAVFIAFGIARNLPGLHALAP